MPPPSRQRQPLDLTWLVDDYARPMKLRTSFFLPENYKKKTISLQLDSFVPILQAHVGSPVSVTVHRYRLLVPIAQIIRESIHKVRRVQVATDADIFTIRNALIRLFGGVTVLHQPPAPAFGVGARDPLHVLETLEQNEHVAFEVYSAPLQEADDFFNHLRGELEDGLQEGAILIERQQVALIGRS